MKWPLSLTLFSVVACGLSAEEERQQEEASKRAAERLEAGECPLSIPRGFEPAYAVSSARRIDSHLSPRMAVTLTVPAGLSEDAVVNNMRHAACEYSAEVGAVGIIAYKAGSPVEGSFTAGKLDFAPGGSWSDANADVPLSGWREANVRVAALYLNPPKTLPVGSSVVLMEATQPSAHADRWGDDDLLRGVKAGTQATIVEVADFSTGDDALIRYKVEFERKRDPVGWLWSSDIEPAPTDE